MPVSENARIVQHSLQLLAAHRNELSAHFYGRLFGRYPHLEPYFGSNDKVWQERMFVVALRSVMQVANSPAEFHKQLVGLREVHDRHGVKPEYFELFADVLIESLAYYGGRGWTPEVEEVWRSVVAETSAALSGRADGMAGESSVTGRFVA